MKVVSRDRRSLLISLLAGLALAAVVLPLLAAGAQKNLQRDALAANATRAVSYGDLINSLYRQDIRLARDLTNHSDVAAFHQTMINEQATWPEVTGAYLFAPGGDLLFGLLLNPNGTAARVFAPPVGLRLGSRTTLGRSLTATLGRNVEGHVFSFAAGAGRLGDFYILEPVTNLDNRVTGALVLRIDNEALIGAFVEREKVLVTASPFIISAETAALTARHRVQVFSGTPADQLADPSIMGGVSPVVDSSLGRGAMDTGGHFTYHGADVTGGAGPMPDVPGVNIVAYAATPTFGEALGQTLAGGAGIVALILLLAGAAGLFVYQDNRARAAAAARERRRSEALSGDILTMSTALTAARNGDLTVEVPNSASEVGLVSVMVNGLLGDYGDMVSGIIRASVAVQEGAQRIDDSVRSIVDVAVRQGEEMAVTAGTVETLAASAVAVQQATRQATELAADASRTVQQGQEAVTRVGEAVDSIKEAAIGTTREFKHLQEDSIRLTALVSSVKSNAENLDMQAANATLEARHLGTETGSAFATNIGRLARQAQETLADAETAVRSVVASIDAVNRRIERISEQVRLGVDEVRSIRGTFAGITTTNEALVEFIEGVAGSAYTQSESAQSVAASIAAIVDAFRQFNDLLVASSDEMTSMRLVVADLRESVSTLKVADTAIGRPTLASGEDAKERAA